MSLENYSDLSTGPGDVNAGFQYEFSCPICRMRWRSTFQPYRMGQASSIIGRFVVMFSGLRNTSLAGDAFSDMGSRGARERALETARKEASARFAECSHCHRGVCRDCYDNSAGSCVECARGTQSAGGRGGASAGGGAATGHACPNCGTPGDGGRFCPECGFDMASTHKSCPGCGNMVARSARFCTDCGHAF